MNKVSNQFIFKFKGGSPLPNPKIGKIWITKYGRKYGFSRIWTFKLRLDKRKNNLLKEFTIVYNSWAERE